MRCPKCGYISFDRQEACVKCNADVTAVAEQLRGTVADAEAPYFLGSVLGGQAVAFHGQPEISSGEEETAFDLGELDADALPEHADFEGGESDLDLAGAPLDDEEIAGPVLQPLGLEDIDVSDLVPPQDDEAPELSLDVEEEAVVVPPEPEPLPEEEEQGLAMDIELPSLDDEDLLSSREEAEVLGEYGEKAEAAQAADEDEIVDLSSLMDLGGDSEPPAEEEAVAADKGGDFDLSLDDDGLADGPEEGSGLELSLEEDEDRAVSRPAPEKNRAPGSDIPDLGLTLENDSD
ncbi:hypothetical protein ACUUL3_16070 [Thiovibrio sp. JS02]